MPELPKLPELPGIDDNKNLPQLPSFPRSLFGEKFSQDSIKNAIAGEKEDESGFDADESESEEETMMMQKPVGKNLKTKELENEDEYKRFQKFERRTLETPSFSDYNAPYKRT